MNVLYLDWPCFGQIDAVFTLEHELHCKVFKFFHDGYKDRVNAEFSKAFDEAVEGKQLDFCFSFNFYPILAEDCHRHNLKYISLLYDNPMVALYSYRISYPTNYVFLFDSVIYRHFHDGGLPNVYYTVLPVNSTVIDTMLKKPYDKKRTTADISFVGALYNEDHNFYDRLYEKVDDFTRGFLDGLVQSQMQVSGYNFLEEILNEHPELIEVMHKAEPYDRNRDGIETLPYIYSSYYLCRKITSLERIKYLTAVGAHHPIKMFTLNSGKEIPGVKNMGITDYYGEMPLVFHNSKINLNITLRSIFAGIPLRCMDILGAGGFLLTNYQQDLLDYFIPGEDFDYFEDETDLLRKVDYYLEHDDIRSAIARRGHEKAKKEHSFKKCFSHMLEIALN